MSVAQEIENLNELKNKGIISQLEFEHQKKRLLNQFSVEQSPSLSRNIYILLAFFLGWLGVHNFYAGYKGRGAAQIVLTLLFWLGIPALILCVWILVDMLAVTKDAKGQPMLKINCWGIILIVLFVLGSLFTLLSIIGVLAVGGIAGYTMAMNRYQANEVVHLSAQYAAVSTSVCEQVNNMSNCDLIVPSFCDVGLVPAESGSQCSVKGHVIGRAQVNNVSVTVPVQFASQAVCKAVVSILKNQIRNENCDAAVPSLSLVFSTPDLKAMARSMGD